MSGIRLLWESIRHTPASMLAARARLLAKRRTLAVLTKVAPIDRIVHGRGGPRLRDALPLPVFPALEPAAGGFRTTARFLNLEMSIVPPVDWRPAVWDRGTKLEILTLHYMEWLAPLEDALFTAAIDDWMARVRPYGPDAFAWNSYALSIRCVVWLQQLAVRRPRLDPSFVARCAASIVSQIRFLETNLEEDIRGNHIVRNIRALLWAARSFEGSEADAWRRDGERLLARELPAQVLSDGVHFERSPSYHTQVLGDLVECAAVLPSGDAKSALLAAVDRMGAALAALTHPDGAMSLFGDGALHMTVDPATVRSALLSVGGHAHEAPAEIALPAAGFRGVRHGMDLVLVKCGPIGDDGLPAHAHGDVGSFEWTLDGQRLIVDAGVFEYHPGPMRAWSRATASHNTVTVDDADQAEFYGAFRVGRRPRVSVEDQSSPGRIVTTIAHDGYERLPGRPRHRRRFEASAAAIVVTDTIDGGQRQPVRSRLLLHPGTTLHAVPGGVELRCGAARARLLTDSAWSVMPSPWCPDFGVRRETQQIVIEYGPAPCRGAFSLEKF